MAPPNAEELAAAQAAHQALINQLDIASLPKPFRSHTWRPNQRRNKNIKAILGDTSRKEASSLAATQDNSGAVTPLPDTDTVMSDSGTSTAGDSTPALSTTGAQLQPNLAQASKSLSKLVLERNFNRGGRPPVATGLGPGPTYMNIESAPSLAHAKHYCDITGLLAPYTDPKTRLRYHNKEVFAIVRTLGQGVAEQYLEARGAHTVLK